MLPHWTVTMPILWFILLSTISCMTPRGKSHLSQTCRTCEDPSTVKREFIVHNNKEIFLTGVNLGNVHLFPFEQNPYGLSSDELKETLVTAFSDLKNAGANSYRVWLHIDGSKSPSFNQASGEVTHLAPEVLADLRWMIEVAYRDYGLLANITLWSHDLLAIRRDHSVNSRDRVVNIVKNPDAYLKNVLIPLISSMKASIPHSNSNYRDGILSWEIFNEPEGASAYWRLYWNYQYAMKYGEYFWREESLNYLDDRSRTEFAEKTGKAGFEAIKYKGWYFIGTFENSFNLYMYKDFTDVFPSEWDHLKKLIVDDKSLFTVDIPHTEILRFINLLAGAIHRADPTAKVSCGAHSMPYNTNVQMPHLRYNNAPKNYYADDILTSAGHDPLGTLDFYQVHGYPDWSNVQVDEEINMFKSPKSHWNITKPLIVGEHWDIVGVGNEELTTAHYTHLHDQGYAGVWGWAYFEAHEKKDPRTGEFKTYLGLHKNWDKYREVLTQIPARIKYLVN